MTSTDFRLYRTLYGMLRCYRHTPTLVLISFVKEISTENCQRCHAERRERRAR